MKTNLKIILLVGILLITMCVFGANTVKATDVTEVEKKAITAEEIMALFPVAMELDITELEFSKAEELIMTDIKAILKNEGIQYEEKSYGLYLTNVAINGDNVDISVDAPTIYSGKEYFYKANISLHCYKDVAVTYHESREMDIFYNNSKNYNAEDEAYVKNLKIESPKYHVADIDLFETDFTPSNQFEIIGNSYTKLINDSSIVVKAEAGAGGAEGGLNSWTAEDGTSIAIFRNGVLYDIRTMGCEVTVPIINVSGGMSEEEMNKHIIDVIKAYYPEYGSSITKIEKGTQNIESMKDFTITDGYTIYVDEASEFNSSALVIIKSTSSDKVVSADEQTNVKLETTGDVVPANTVLEVTPITEGTDYNTIKTVLSDMKNFKVFDITLKSDGVEIQPNGKVKISIPIPENFDVSNLVAYRIEKDGTKIEYKINIVTINGIKYAQFETDHFSYYVLAEVEETLDNSPKMGVNDNIIVIVSTLLTIISLGAVITIRK